MTELQTKFRNGIYGVATGNALGTPVQFCSREELRKYPITGMKDDGTGFRREPGVMTQACFLHWLKVLEDLMILIMKISWTIL